MLGTRLFVTLALSSCLAAASACTASVAYKQPHDKEAPPADGDPAASVTPPVDKPPTTTQPPGPDPSVALDPNDAKAFDAFVADKMTAGKIPGITLAIVRSGKLAYAHAYGLADKEANKPMSTQSIIEIASISKTVTGLSLMQLEDAGKVALDEDVSKYLLKPLRNPRFPNDPITLRQLMTHTSSIESNDQVLDPLFAEGADSPTSLADLTAQYFYTGGRQYSINNFGTTKPGTTMSYCNICIALVGYVVERVSGKPFQTYTKENVFAPLGMTSTTWLLAETDKTRLATPYEINPRTGAQSPAPHLGLPDWPAGSLKTTASDYALYLAAISSGGAAGDKRLLPKAKMDDMLRVQLPAAAAGQGLVFYESNRNGATVWGHNGSLPGISSIMDFTPGTGNGVVVLTNTDWPESPNPEPALVTIETKALELAAKK